VKFYYIREDVPEGCQSQKIGSLPSAEAAKSALNRQPAAEKPGYLANAVQRREKSRRTPDATNTVRESADYPSSINESRKRALVVGVPKPVLSAPLKLVAFEARVCCLQQWGRNVERLRSPQHITDDMIGFDAALAPHVA
jgi:hypothetical protein